MSEVINQEGTAADIAAVPALRVMDEELYNRVNAIFSSSDKSNYIIGEEILLTVDMGKSIYWVWKLTRNHWWKFNRRRKSVREKITNNPIVSSIWSANTYNFASRILGQGLMTQEIWDKVKTDVEAVVMTRSQNPFFNVETKLKPSLW